jgi:hypothetical protein
MVRLTKSTKQRILEQNEGFSRRTYFDGTNSKEERIYTISGGALHIRAVGNTSWGDSRYDDVCVSTDEETHRFLYKHKLEMNLDGIE